MIVPVRCFSCGKVIGEYYDEYLKRIKNNEKPEQIMNDLKINRYCCRRTLFTHIDLFQEIAKYPV